MSPYSSLILLIARMNSRMKSIIIDFMFLNSRLQRVNLTFALIRGTFAILASFTCEYLSVLELKDTYHRIKVLESSKPYCGILSYFDSSSYVYQNIPMGLSTSPAIWQSYINAILSSILNRSKYLAILDDLLLLSSKHGHLEYLEDLPKVLLRCGVKYHWGSVNFLELSYNSWVTPFVSKGKSLY